MRALSTRQQQIVDFIGCFWDTEGLPPTIRDIVRGCNLSSTSVADYNLNVLEREGYIRRRREVSRGIDLAGRSPARRAVVEVPVIGQVAAGSPIPVPTPDVWDTTAAADTLTVARDLTRGREEVYALKVRGTSMVDALVNDGDIVLMENVRQVENGQMAAVWLKAEREATLKRFYAEGERVRLQPANRQMGPIYADSDNVEVQGRVIAVLRRLS